MRHVIGKVLRIIYTTQDFTLHKTAVVVPTARQIRPWRFQHPADPPTSLLLLIGSIPLQVTAKGRQEENRDAI